MPEENHVQNTRLSWISGILIYLGIYLVSPFLASAIYWLLIFLFPDLRYTDPNQFLYFNLAMLVQTAAAFLLVYLLVLHPQQRGWKTVGFVLVKADSILKYGLLGGFLLFIGIFSCSLLLTYIQPELPPQSFENILSRQSGWLPILLLMLYASVLAPLTEEMLFRGMLYTWLRERLRVFPAMVVAGLIFGLVHYDIWRAIPLALGGMALCFIYEKTGSIWVTTVSHGLWNFIMTGIVVAGMFLTV